MEELNSSELGTQQYWESTYRDELRNFEDHGDIGEVWFGEDSVARIVTWICRCDAIREDSPIIDIGCGNGFSLLELAREGYTNLTGVDYSAEAIRLAKKLLLQEFPNIKLKKLDLIEDEIEEYKEKYQVIHDKGTYDAISLSPDDPKAKRIKYLEAIHHIMADDGLFIITSCNWTESELVTHFEDLFKLKCIIPTPQFKFGGKTGSVVSSAVFIKKLKCT